MLLNPRGLNRGLLGEHDFSYVVWIPGSNHRIIVLSPQNKELQIKSMWLETLEIPLSTLYSPQWFPGSAWKSSVELWRLVLHCFAWASSSKCMCYIIHYILYISYQPYSEHLIWISLLKWSGRVLGSVNALRKREHGKRCLKDSSIFWQGLGLNQKRSLLVGSKDSHFFPLPSTVPASREYKAALVSQGVC